MNIFKVKERMALIMHDVNIKGFPKVVLYTENQVKSRNNAKLGLRT